MHLVPFIISIIKTKDSFLVQGQGCMKNVKWILPME